MSLAYIKQGICNRIGLDMVGHVLPFLSNEGDDGDPNKGDDNNINKDAVTHKTSFTHEEFVKGAEECLLIEEEMAELEEHDPEYLEQLEREALAEDPEIVAEIIEDVLKQDNTLLVEIAAKLMKDTPDVVKEMEGMLGEDEKLETRPDVVGFIVAKLLSDEENLGLLDEFDEALSEHFFDDDDEWDDGENIGGGDEL